MRMFSPIFDTCATRSASRSAFGLAASFFAMSSQNARKFSLRATKSVSQFTSTRMPTRDPGWMYCTIKPSFASRPAFLAAEATPRLRRRSTALSKFPLASVRAFLHSISPALVISRSLPTFAADISAIIQNINSFSQRIRRADRSGVAAAPSNYPEALGRRRCCHGLFCHGRNHRRDGSRRRNFDRHFRCFGGFRFSARIFGLVLGPSLRHHLHDSREDEAHRTD